jgi:serine/threonine protein kinase
MNQPPDVADCHILKLLGRGGTAAVYQVFSEAYKKELALKCPLNDDPQSRPTFAKLAQREHHLIGRLKFPGLVRILEISPHHPEYLLMELCRGPTLDQCGQIGNITLALNIISAIALNLEFLRVHGIIHGDLKPHNIFLPEDWPTLDDNRLFYVKLSDFSLGRLSCEPETDRIGVGTVGYMAPETIAESRSGFQSDIFALGVIAYRMLTGVHPFMDAENDPVKINSRIREENPTPIQTIRPDVSQELVELIDRLLAKSESDRPQSGWEVCQAFDKLGAQYPYQKALRPAHFFLRDSNSSEGVQSVLQMSEAQSQRLDLLTQKDARLFRLILTANFLRGSLRYDGQHFNFSQEMYWPLVLRRRSLRTYQQLPPSFKKLVVKTAIVGKKDDAGKLGLIKDNELTNVPEGVMELIRQFVTPRVVKKYSAIYAAKAEQRSLYELASGLYVQAGNLEGAERCVYQAAHALSNEHLKDRALKILNHVIDYAQMTNRPADVRQLMMIKADTYKENGEADRALATYHQIIDLYRTLTPDKLLAETYKDLGDLYKVKQDFSAGIEALQNALKIYQELHDELEISHTLNNIGNIYWIDSKLDLALKHYRRALRIQHGLQVAADVASTLSNIASIHVVKGRYKWSIRVMNLS